MYKLRHWLLLLFLVAVPFTVSSQNLVRNGSFEQDDYWDDFLDTFSVPSSNIRDHFEFYIKTLRNVHDWTDRASTWTVDITSNGLIVVGIVPNKYNPKISQPIDSMNLYKELLLHPWFIDDRVFTDNFRDSVFHKAPIRMSLPDDYTREVLPYYPNKALHGHKYIYLETAPLSSFGIESEDDLCVLRTSNYRDYSYLDPYEDKKCPGCPQPRTFIPSMSVTNDIISNKLISPTKKGKKYKIGFFASVANNYVDSAMIDSLNANPIKIKVNTDELWTSSFLYFKKRQGNYRTYASDALGVLLTKREPVAFIPGEGEFYADSTNIPSDRISLESTSQQFRIPKPLMNHAEWEEFSWEFTADDEYTYLNIGNFWKHSQLNFIRWKFHFFLLNPSEATFKCPPSGALDYIYHDIGYFIDSVYLIPLGPKIAPYQKNACIGDTVHIQDINKKEVTWFLEDGSSSLSDLLSIVINKPVTRIIAEAVGEYDTMYIYAKSIPQYELLHTDSLCVPAGQPFNKLLAIANEPQVHFSWNQNGKVQDSSLFVSADTGMAQLKLTDSIGCKYVFHIPLEEYCPCVILPSDTIICKGASLSISDYYGRAIDWAIDGVNQGNSISLTVKPNKWQTTITGSCDGLSQSMHLYIKEPPQAILTHTDSMCIWTGKLYNKLNLSSEESISGVWEFNGAIYTGLHFESMDTGIVYYKALDSLGCETHGATYLGEYCPEFSDICAFPSAFSPNGDGLNDVLTIDCINIKSFKATILDRWGEVIGMSSDANHVWDGTYKGQEVATGVYAFLIEYEVYLEPGKKYYYKGTLTLVR